MCYIILLSKKHNLRWIFVIMIMMITLSINKRSRAKFLNWEIMQWCCCWTSVTFLFYFIIIIKNVCKCKGVSNSMNNFFFFFFATIFLVLVKSKFLKKIEKKISKVYDEKMKSRRSRIRQQDWFLCFFCSFSNNKKKHTQK